MNKKQIRLTESDLKQIVKESVNRIVKESDELDANDWKARYLRDAHYPIDMKDIENKASWETFDDNVNSLYGQRGCYNDDYASQAYADDPFSDFYGLENKNTYDLKGYLAKRKLNKLAKNESKNMTKKLIRLTESDLHRIVKESVNKVLMEDVTDVDLSQIIAKLEELTQSGYIPFASPSPSSTEMIIKKNILQAIDCLKKAAAADNELYGQYS